MNQFLCGLQQHVRPLLNGVDPLAEDSMQLDANSPPDLPKEEVSRPVIQNEEVTPINGKGKVCGVFLQCRRLLNLTL